ncbi:MAG TPA: hypothetical protein VGQ77_07875 [Methylomirabilota bacterium]|jgi:hypothetical protein|nr:hypothetical protein [Methylomirabilota bacterium]
MVNDILTVAVAVAVLAVIATILGATDAIAKRWRRPRAGRCLCLLAAITLVAGVIQPATATAQSWVLVAPVWGGLSGPHALQMLDKQPVNRWHHIGTYDTAVECATEQQEALTTVANTLLAVFVRWAHSNSEEARDNRRVALSDRQRLSLSRCMSAADPRLVPDPR